MFPLNPVQSPTDAIRTKKFLTGVSLISVVKTRITARAGQEKRNENYNTGINEVW